MSEKEEKSIFYVYQREIGDIKDILKHMKNGEITEFTDAKMHGSLYTNAKNVEDKLNDLLKKIDKDLPSINDELSELF
ncbi:hypothetical protein JHE06_05465 [Carnobacterium sp. CS13]|uniref:hypothetical protein n=1 Tax=Carnobacterium sp. CS13 TaxID=2800128 RepID=UPI001912B6D0|nr:hypothetical protein [Carnobacterium sp. CS13]QQP71219.1 hypothetical protein JHE06_05465 [Carnobacterium sp. CS13]